MTTQWKKFFERLLTGIIFVIAVLFLILYNEISLHIFLWIVAFFCSYEYLSIRMKDSLNKLLLLLLALIIGVLLPVLNYFGIFSFSPILPIIILSVLYQIFLFSKLYFSVEYAKSPLSIISSSFLYIGLPILLLNQLMMGNGSKFLLLGIILVIWASDTFAYLVGSIFGKHKLMPAISPGKTMEGAIGGGVFAIIVGIIIFYVWPQGTMFFHIGLAIVIWITGLYGDLVESQLKRTFGLKDSGNILPGHGGFLDRFDSFIYLIPFVLLYFELFV